MRPSGVAMALIALSTLVSISNTASSEATPAGRADSHAPIGVMGDHVHHKGEVMFSLRYMRMSMTDNLDGTNRLSTGDVFVEGYMVSPTAMDMEMYMFGIMYAPIDRLTVVAMVPFVRLAMDHETRTGVKFTTRSKGIGDIQLSTMTRLLDEDEHHLHLNFGFSIPTGSIDDQDNVPASMGNDVQLPYPMQIGSGSLELVPGITYTALYERFSLGAQALGQIPLYENSNDYTVGSRYHVTAWGAGLWAPWISTSLRFAWRQWFDYGGADPKLDPAVVPTADPDLRAGRRLDAGVGVNLYAPRGALRGWRFGVEGLFPIYQSLDGPQLKTDWTVVAGLQYSF